MAIKKLDVIDDPDMCAYLRAARNYVLAVRSRNGLEAERDALNTVLGFADAEVDIMKHEGKILFDKMVTP